MNFEILYLSLENSILESGTECKGIIWFTNANACYDNRGYRIMSIKSLWL